jgi:Ras-related protein Rab-1A
VKYVDKNGEKVKVVLVNIVSIQWDTAGQERFRTITNGYYRGADGILIVYDLTDRDSFENVNMWYEEMSRSVNQKVVCILVGNKLDMNSRRAVSTEEGHKLGISVAMQLKSSTCLLLKPQPNRDKM